MSERSALSGSRSARGAAIGSLSVRGSTTIPAVAVSAYVLSRLATFVTASGIALISGRSMGEVLSLWDGGWYLSIVRDGYPSFVPSGIGVASQSSLAFFPGYPLLVRTLSELLGVSPVFAGCAVSLLAGLGATVAVWHMAVRLSDQDTADRTVVLFAFLPSAFVMSMVYADALFLVLAACCLIALMDERWLTAGAAAAAAGLVRPTAVALCVACAWAAIAAIRRGERWRAMIAPMLAPSGALLYLGYVWTHTRDALAFFEVQNRGWGNRIDIGAANVRAVLRHLGDHRLTFLRGARDRRGRAGRRALGPHPLACSGIHRRLCRRRDRVVRSREQPDVGSSFPPGGVPTLDPDRQATLREGGTRTRCHMRRVDGNALLRDRVESHAGALTLWLHRGVDLGRRVLVSVIEEERKLRARADTQLAVDV